DDVADEEQFHAGKFNHERHERKSESSSGRESAPSEQFEPTHVGCYNRARMPIITAIIQRSSTARVRLKPARTSRCERWLVSPIQNGLRLSVRETTTCARSMSGMASTSSGDSTASGCGFCLV